MTTAAPAIADMEREIAAAIRKAFRRLDADGHEAATAPPGVARGTTDPAVTDPAVIDRIEDAFLLATYRAELSYRRRLAGEAPPPRHAPRLPERLAEARRSVKPRDE